MPHVTRRPIPYARLSDYFREAFRPREEYRVGMELEKHGLVDGRPLPYDGEPASVRGTLVYLRDRRGGDPVYEGDKLIGIEAPWGSITLEPGGQVEWSSQPVPDLDRLDADLRDHLAALSGASDALGIRWGDRGVLADVPLDAMPWMPKARYGIMRDALGARGRLAHRMMTQTASIQCAFDFSSEEDWVRKFRTAALLAPVAVALFANSSRIDGKESGYRSYRQAIWRETDPDRCDVPAIVFETGFDLERWVAWCADVPTIFVRRGNGLVPSGGVPFRRLLDRCGCDAVTIEDWELHLSTIFTEVRSYAYIEARSADLQPDDLALAVPAFWTGLLYHDDSLDAALRLGVAHDTLAAWRAAMEEAARHGLDGEAGGRSLRDLAARALGLAAWGLSHGAACAGGDAGTAALDRLARRAELDPVEASP